MLIGYSGTGTSVVDVTVNDVTCEGSATGGLVGYNADVIKNCQVNRKLTSSVVSGLIGGSDIQINSLNLINSSIGGGLVGSDYAGYIINSYAMSPSE